MLLAHLPDIVSKMSFLRNSIPCLATLCYLKCRAYGTHHHEWFSFAPRPSYVMSFSGLLECQCTNHFLLIYLNNSLSVHAEVIATRRVRAIRNRAVTFKLISRFEINSGNNSKVLRWKTLKP